MKLRQSLTIILLVLATCFFAVAQSKPSSNDSPLPAPTGMVNDYANIIDDPVQAQIEQKLRDFKAKTNPPVEIAVVTVKTTGERPIFDYSMAVARSWGIGSKDDDNPSALILIAVDDKKYFTQISNDLEDELTDGISGQLQRQYLVPAFKQGNFTKGVNDTVDAFIRTIEERKSAPTGTPSTTNDKKRAMPFGFYCLICLVVVVILLVIIFARRGGGSGGSGGSGSNRWRSGGFGGNTGHHSSPNIFWGGGGSSSSSDWGSSSSGGGDSWGGFGGGGDFGGGGSGGDW